MWRGVAVTVGVFGCESVGGWLSAVNSTRPNSRVDLSTRSSLDVNLERHPRARSRNVRRLTTVSRIVGRSQARYLRIDHRASCNDCARQGYPASLVMDG